MSEHEEAVAKALVTITSFNEYAAPKAIAALRGPIDGKDATERADVVLFDYGVPQDTLVRLIDAILGPEPT